MEKLLEILRDVKSDVDFEHCTTLIDDGYLDSFDIIAIVGEVDSEFGVHIPVEDLEPDDFNSASAIWALIQRLKEE